MTTRRYSDVLHDPRHMLSDLARHAEKLAALSAMVRAHLPDDQRPHVHVGAFRDGVLHVFTDNAALATRLRIQAPTLCEELRRHDHLDQLLAIKIRVSPALLKVAHPQHKIIRFRTD